MAVRTVSIWSDRDAAPGAATIAYTNGLLYTPEGDRVGGPVVLLVHRWGGYHYDRPYRDLGEAFADRGWSLLSFGLSRRGVEGQIVGLPDADSADISRAIDFLSGLGHADIILAGDEIGALSVARYCAKRLDGRVRGIVLIRPIADPPAWLKGKLGDAAYNEAVARAGRAAKLGSGLDQTIDLRPDGIRIFQYAAPFLAWWGGLADTRITRHLDTILPPILALGGDLLHAPRLTSGAAGTSAADIADAVIGWANVAPAGTPVTLEVLETAGEDGSPLTGFLWTPAEPTDTVMVYVHGMGAPPIRSLPATQAPWYATAGMASFAPGLRRSGRLGQMTYTPEDDIADIDRWLHVLADRGYTKIVTSGHSLGSIGITLAQAHRPHPNVVANVHLAPTAEGVPWARNGMGSERYEAAVAKANAAIAAGDDRHIVDDDYRLPDPDSLHHLSRHNQYARSWIGWWGPESLNQHAREIAAVNVPILLLCGTDDTFNDEARLVELTEKATNSPRVDTIWYQDINHSFDTAEYRLVADVTAWLREIGVIR